jgi:hypothetical protein
MSTSLYVMVIKACFISKDLGSSEEVIVVPRGLTRVTSVTLYQWISRVAIRTQHALGIRGIFGCTIRKSCRAGDI